MFVSTIRNLPQRIICILILVRLTSGFLFADALEDWQKIVALDAGPGGDAQTREQARKLMIGHFDQQERSLENFVAKYPADTHNFEAQMRLSHLLAMRSDLEGKPEYYVKARRILDALQRQNTTPKERLPDVAYSLITLLMHNNPDPDERGRDNLMAYVRKFQINFPTDHRSGRLLAEMASLYDTDPKKKRELLDEALRYADEEGLKQRINDDFKRLELLGRPLALKFDSIQGEAIEISKYQGKVVLIYFFANWARPSVLGLEELKRIAKEFPAGKFQLIGISLDKTRETLDATMSKTGIGCPVYYDGKGWQSPLARSLGINALPTAWVLDKNGNLRTLNAMNRTEGIISELLKEK